MIETIPLAPSNGPLNTGKYRHGDSNPGTNPSSRGLRNCILMQPTELLLRRVPLPVVRLPHEWHEDTFVLRSRHVPGNKGKRYKKTPPTLEEAYAIIAELRYTAEKWRPKFGKIGDRNATLAAFLLGTGVRIHEALLVRPRDIDQAHKTVHIIKGKGGKERFSLISPYALGELQQWLEQRAALGFTDTQPVFCVLEGPNAGGHMAQGYVRKRLTAAGRAAGIDKRVVCHQWRHAHALHLDRSGVRISSISRQLGHSNIATTSIYLEGLSAESIAEDVLSAWGDDQEPSELDRALARIAELEALLAVSA